MQPIDGRLGEDRRLPSGLREHRDQIALRVFPLPRLQGDLQFGQSHERLAQPGHPFVAAGQHDRQPRLGRRIEPGKPGKVLQYGRVGLIDVIGQQDRFKLLIAGGKQQIADRPPKGGCRRPPGSTLSPHWLARSHSISVGSTSNMPTRATGHPWRRQ